MIYLFEYVFYGSVELEHEFMVKFTQFWINDSDSDNDNNLIKISQHLQCSYLVYNCSFVFGFCMKDIPIHLKNHKIEQKNI